MKKLLFKIILIIIAIIALWAGFNLITDISEPRFDAAKDYDTSNIISFLNDLFPPIPVTRENGFFKLWTLSEPLDVDIDSDELFKTQKKLNDPETATIQGIKDWYENKWNKKKRAFNKELTKKRREIFKKSTPWDNYPQFANKDWGRVIIKEKKYVLEMQKLLQPLLDRYEKVIEAEYFEDYTLIVLEKDKVNFTAPIPNLLTWLYVAKQHTAINILNALEGDWVNSTDKLIEHVEFAKKATKGSRTLITNLIGKAVQKITLFGIASIMNQPDCPSEVFELLLRKLDEIEDDEYGSVKPLLAEGFSMSQVKSFNPLFQKNRTKKYYFDHLSKILKNEKTPPYKWADDIQNKTNVKRGFFWWVQNPFGKHHYKEYHINLPTIVLKSWQLKTTYDMVRISAELHLKYDPAKSVQENLNELELYKSHFDPCSGKPYKWQKKKQMLYSFGADRDDDGGKDGPLVSWDADFFIPVHLYIK